MDQDIPLLAHELVQLLEKIGSDRRLLVGIAGIPASGKTTLAILLTEYTNRLLISRAEATAGFITGNTPARAVLVGLDGWHLTRAQLDAMPDPAVAHDRRGIHWTFDAKGYVAFVRSLREALVPGVETVIRAPSFDHAHKDPIPDAIAIYPYHRIVILEGLYTFVSIEPWNIAGSLLDERWLIQANPDEAQRRLVKRHVETGVARNLKEAWWRAEENDMPNGRFLVSNTLEPTRLIVSKHDPTIALAQNSDAETAN
ncbi:hypothetical protein AX17_006334 [Amanita inopinata Kibby_2008]|nr:hypothetical protein AX17_006334 [Amanita inopinata Kibby_2008]